MTHAANFRLITRDIPWDEQVLMEQFRSGLRSDVKTYFVPSLRIQNHLQKLLVEQYGVIIAFLSVDVSDTWYFITFVDDCTCKVWAY